MKVKNKKTGVIWCLERAQAKKLLESGEYLPIEEKAKAKPETTEKKRNAGK